MDKKEEPFCPFLSHTIIIPSTNKNIQSANGQMQIEARLLKRPCMNECLFFESCATFRKQITPDRIDKFIRWNETHNILIKGKTNEAKKPEALEQKG